MSEAIAPPVVPAAPPVPPAPPAPPSRRGRPLAAWVVIFGVVGLILYLKERRAEGPSTDWLVPMQAEARFLVGAASLTGGPSEKLYKEAQGTLDRGSYPQRQRFAILAGELAGPDEALRRLKMLRSDSAAARARFEAGESDAARRRADEALAGSERSAEVTAILEKLYRGYQMDPHGPPAVMADEAARLRKGLGWFGDLALAPRGGDPAARHRAVGPARRTFVGVWGLLGAALLALFVGLLLLVGLAASLYVGLTRGALQGGGNGGLYAETFALYLVLFSGLSYLSRFLPDRPEGLEIQAAVMILSLGALAWPVFRGVPWAEVRSDLGLYSDRPGRDVLLGVGTYLSAVPLVGTALLVALVVRFAGRRLGLDEGGSSGASHPLMQRLLGGDGWLWLQVVVVVCVLAPLVEEIMFRGALYRHLRELPLGGQGGRVAFAIAASGFVFAVIHPYDWKGVLVLVALATALALAREWRGSLIPSMVAHAIQNGLGTLILWLFVV